MPSSNYEPLDGALEALAGSDITLKNGNSNHAPMVAEALCAMGRPQAVMPWIVRYKERLLPRPATGDPIRAETWRSALGQRDRFADWAEFFGEELRQAPWREVLDRWTGRLMPGFCAAATHGAIRVGHAVRSLAATETSWRRRELGDALASWAATYRELPSSDRITDRPMAPREAILNVPVIAPDQRRPLGNITASLAMLDDLPKFPPIIGLIDVSGDIETLLAELTETFARIYLANAHDVPTTIVFIHGVTSLAAFGGVIPNVGETTARSALRYAWQSGCALYACFGARAMGEDIEPCAENAETLIDRAVANGDEHVIKFTEACLRRNALAPSPIYRAAVDHALGTMPRR
jgi:questin oxidase-like protein